MLFDYTKDIDIFLVDSSRPMPMNVTSSSIEVPSVCILPEHENYYLALRRIGEKKLIRFEVGKHLIRIEEKEGVFT